MIYVETQVMRIFALSGKYIRTPNRFAISNFILQAMDYAKINLNLIEKL